MPSLHFLGSSDSQGVPRWWCDCSVCEEARTTGKNARTRPAVVIEGGERILIDTPPELKMQCTKEGFKRFDAVLITHAHNDHILGLGEIADRARWTREPCPIYAPNEVLPLIKQRFFYLDYGIYPEVSPLIALEQAARTFAGYHLRAVKVPHGYNGWAYGFRFDGSGGSWAYIPDSLNIEDLTPWYGLDLLVLGTSFYRESVPVHTRSVYDVAGALGFIAQVNPGRVIFTHLGHGIDAGKPAPPGTFYARDGLTVSLP